MNTAIEVRANLQWQVTKGSGGSYVGTCDPLGLTVQGDSEEELHSVIAELHHTLLVDLLEDGELDRFLLDRGWSLSQAVPADFLEAGTRFELPFTVVSQPLHG